MLAGLRVTPVGAGAAPLSEVAVVARILERSPLAYQVHLMGTFGDLVERGIIDPTKVVHVALENAVSVASVLLLSEATLTEIEEPKVEPAAMRE